MAATWIVDTSLLRSQFWIAARCFYILQLSSDKGRVVVWWWWGRKSQASSESGRQWETISASWDRGRLVGDGILATRCKLPPPILSSWVVSPRCRLLAAQAFACVAYLDICRVTRVFGTSKGRCPVGRVVILEHRTEVRARLDCWQRDWDWIRAPTACGRNEKRT